MLRTELKTLQDPITLGSNFQFLVRLLVDIKGVSADNPTIFRFMRELIARMSTLQFRQELESSSLEEQIQTLYALVSYESHLFHAWLRYVLKRSSIIAAMIKFSFVDHLDSDLLSREDVPRKSHYPIVPFTWRRKLNSNEEF